MSGRLAGKVALVTGAATGIGRALAEGLAGEGAVVHANDLEPPGSTLEALPADRRGLALGHDISSISQVEEMFGRLAALDVLVNCAGVTGWIDLAAPDEATWDRVIGTNLKGTFFCSTAAVPLLRARGGRDREHLERRRRPRPHGPLCLRGEQGRDRLAHGPARLRARPARDPRQRRRPRGDERRAESA